jgi:ribonuclease PH
VVRIGQVNGEFGNTNIATIASHRLAILKHLQSGEQSRVESRVEIRPESRAEQKSSAESKEQRAEQSGEQSREQNRSQAQRAELNSYRAESRANH